MFTKIVKKLKSLAINMLYPIERQAQLAGVIIGTGNQFFSRFWSSEPYLIEIGDNCQITAGVKIFTHGGGKIARIINPKFDCFGKVKVGNNVYIGNNSLIMPGVSIGNNVLIAAGSVVTHSIPDNVVIGGNPARIICTFNDYYEKNKRFDVGTKGLNSKEKKIILLKLDENRFIRKSVLKL